MEHQLFGTVVNGEACLKLSKAITTKSEYYSTQAADFIKKYKLTLCEFRTLEDILSDYWKNGQSTTFMKKVADIFKKFGFDVQLDEHGIDYLIT